MKTRAALLFFALIPASVLLAQGFLANPGIEDVLDPGVPSCGHISPSSSEYYSFSIEPHASATSLVLKWRDAAGYLKMVLLSPSGREMVAEALQSFKEGKNSASLVLPEPEEGRWTVEVKSSNISADGYDYCLLVEPVRDEEEKSTPFAKFNGLYRNYGVDENEDGIYDYVVLKVGVSVKRPGIYTLEGYLYDINGGSDIPISYCNYLNIGSQSMELELYEMKSPGPYGLKNLVLYDEDENVVDRSSAKYTTREYGEMETKTARLNGNYSDYGSDIDGDGLYDYLTLDVGVDVYAPGNYSLLSFLCDSQGRGLVWSLGFEHLLPGTHTMHVDFDGKTLWESKVNGPYKLCNLSLISGDSSVENLTSEDSVHGTYLTGPYNYTEFMNAE
jgi:hypothetical protein